ncbi:MAG TPA: non-canonical purine NTP pyrophosphatase [bacterium]
MLAPAMAHTPLRFATSNADKIREFSEWLGVPIEPVAMELVEMQGTDLEAIVRHKLVQAREKVRGPVLVEDTSLRFLAWGALPGPFIKHVVENMGLMGLVDALSPSRNWAAEAACGIGYFDGKTEHYVEGRVPGMAVLPMGEHGWGWDPIFRPHGSGRTYGEMRPDEKKAKSMRAVALQKLGPLVANQPAFQRSAVAVT